VKQRRHHLSNYATHGKTRLENNRRVSRKYAMNRNPRRGSAGISTGKRATIQIGIRRLREGITGLRLQSPQILPEGFSNERETGTWLDCSHTFHD
jgi:hypothetical protein